MRVFCELFLLVTLAVHVSSQSTPYHAEQDIGAIPLSDLSHPSSHSNHPSAQQAGQPPSYHEATTDSNTAHNHPAEPPPPYSAVANNRGPNMYGSGQSVPYISTQPVPNSNAMQARPQGSGLGQIEIPAGCEYVAVGVCLMLSPVVIMAATGNFPRELPEKPKRSPKSGKLGKRDAAKAFSQRRILSWSEDDLD
ncbi:hypothetical protein F5890DRAFT_1477566 [Lentinula detonsa]|uniref:Uncharacterized protein n=1 Tax=Lentinula detonsa TaxID=2804962 RepID=A0AA38UNJ6_9AGAR|nr:hypothetical protein F5890DRAFT_1477566 [Lentinula detonsa]